jgi:hypothetical protein
MSTKDMVNFPHIPEEIYDRDRSRNQVTFTGLLSIKLALSKLFSNAIRGEKYAQLIVYDFYLSINNEYIFKENITGKWIELKLSKLLALVTGDEIPRSNPEVDTIMSRENQALFDSDILTMAASNYREKGDLFFVNTVTNSLYKLSIKSLVPTNKEINIGAFEFKNSLYGIDGLEPLLNIQERSRSIELEHCGIRYSNIGMGSQTQLKNMFNYIRVVGKDDEFLTRLEILLRAVYADDLLIYIKENNKMKIYLVDNNSFMTIMLDKIKNGFAGIRVEGNAIRVSPLNVFRESAAEVFEYTFDELLPNRDEIEQLLSTVQAQKSQSLRRFCS